MKKLFLLSLLLLLFTQPIKPAELTLSKTTSSDYGRAGKWIGCLVGSLVLHKTFTEFMKEKFGVKYYHIKSISKSDESFYTAIVWYSLIKGLFCGTITCYLYKTLLHDFFASKKIISEEELKKLKTLLKEENSVDN